MARPVYITTAADYHCRTCTVTLGSGVTVDPARCCSRGAGGCASPVPSKPTVRPMVRLNDALTSSVSTSHAPAVHGTLSDMPRKPQTEHFPHPSALGAPPSRRRYIASNPNQTHTRAGVHWRPGNVYASWRIYLPPQRTRSSHTPWLCSCMAAKFERRRRCRLAP